MNSILTMMAKDKKTKLFYSKCEYQNKTLKVDDLSKKTLQILNKMNWVVIHV